MNSPKDTIEAHAERVADTIEDTTQRVKERQSWLTYLSWTLLLITFGLGLFTGQWEMVFLAVSLTVLTLVPFIFQSLANFRLPRGFVGLIVFFVIATLLLGEYGDFYERFWWWDAVLHTSSAIGFSVIGMLIVLGLVRDHQIKDSPVLMLVLMAFSFSVSLGAVWEVFEFGMDQILGTNMQRSSLIDTMFDLIVDIVGAAIGALGGYIYLKTKRRGGSNPISDTIHKAVEDNPAHFSGT